MKTLTEMEIRALAFWASHGVEKARGGSYEELIEPLLLGLGYPAKSMPERKPHHNDGRAIINPDKLKNKLY